MENEYDVAQNDLTILYYQEKNSKNVFYWLNNAAEKDQDWEKDNDHSNTRNIF